MISLSKPHRLYRPDLVDYTLKPDKLEGNGRLKPENGIGVIKKSTSP
jgi:hypothetical protein